jgi:nucleotide-binding universal stress UspA family protein
MKLMVAYDGSDISQRALMIAQKRAKAMNAELHIFASAANGDTEHPQTSRREAALKDAEMMCKDCGIGCHIELSRRDLSVADDIVRYAKENNIEEIIVGLRKRSQLGKILFGSTSRQVILEAPCPVLTVK